MKLSHFIIIFSIVCVAITIGVNVRVEMLTTSNRTINEYSDALKTAVDDAARVLIDEASYDVVFSSANADNHLLEGTVIRDEVADLETMDIKVNKEKAVDIFYTSLINGLGGVANLDLINELNVYVPVIAIMEQDGYSIYHSAEYTDTSNHVFIKREWTPKKSYAYDDPTFIYLFTLDDNVTLIRKSNNEVIKGNFDSLKGTSMATILDTYEHFDTIRKSSIIRSLETDFSYYINKHNDVARHYGINYQFALPVIEEENWNRAIDDISFIAFFQGYPTSIELDLYNRFSFEAAVAYRGDGYVLTRDISGDLTYHEHDCELLSSLTVINYYGSKKESALAGGKACRICKP